MGEFVGENAKESRRFLDQSKWQVQRPGVGHFTIAQTHRSATVMKAGVLAAFYFCGDKQTSLETPPDIRGPLNELGQMAHDAASRLELSDLSKRREAAEQILDHPLANGIPSVDALEWLLFGLSALGLQIMRTALLAPFEGEIDPDARLVFELQWHEFMYGPNAVVLDRQTGSDCDHFLREWHRLPKGLFGEAALMRVWELRAMAAKMESRAIKLERGFMKRLGRSATRSYGDSVLKDDAGGHAPWDRDSCAYWWNHALGRKPNELGCLWPDTEPADKPKQRVDAVRVFLNSLEGLPELLGPSSQLHNASFFAEQFPKLKDSHHE